MTSALVLAILVQLAPVPSGSPVADSARTVYRLFLVGDTGWIDTPDHPTLRLLNGLADGDPATAVVFLGDNAYPAGLPDPEDRSGDPARRRLQAQLAGIAAFPGSVHFIPGNHDWDHSGPDGIAAVRRQDALVDSLLGDDKAFVPDDALPGPTVIDLEPGPVLVVFDSEWWLRADEKPYGETGRYEIREEGDLLAAIAHVLRREDDRPVVVAAHHALRTNGPHGGHFPVKTHLFPLTELWDWAYVPLPVLGSLYPLYVSWFGGPQDLASARYRSLIDGLETIFSTREELVVYASGHDHSLQHFADDPVHYVVSGSGSSPSTVAAGRGASFASADRGLMELRFLEDGSVDLLAWSTDAAAPGHEPLYRATIRATGEVGGPPPPPEVVSLDDSVTSYTGAVAPSLKAGPLHRLFLGSHHRKAWTTPVTVPVFRAGRRLGGLEPTALGGGMQSLSLRLESADEHEYVLRSLTKNPTRTLPDQLRGTVARDIVLDQVSIIHPFGALLVPTLAEAVGVYHTNPVVVYVPPDEHLAPYTDLVAGRIMLFEERPDDDMSHVPGFGGSTDVVSSSRMYAEVTGDNDHRVDQAFMARARLLDMLISDWDRHADQWRWATFEPPDSVGKIYRPIGRDRDWAFNRMNGILPMLARSPFGNDKWQVFGRSYGQIRGLNRSAMKIDRRFTAGLTREDWVEIAEDMVARLDDATIARAIDAWPESIQALQGPEFVDLLRYRRDLLPTVAGRYYEMISETVDVVGSDKHEAFIVRGVGHGRTEVEVWSTTREGTPRRPYYHRVFDARETREIRLYGLAGDDRFTIEGTAIGTTVYVVGGRGSDRVFDSSTVETARGPRVRVLDTPDGMSLDGGPATLDRRSRDPLVNRYDAGDYPQLNPLPAAFFGHNPEDGLFVGGGATFYRERFRHRPYAARHTLLANVAGRTLAFNLVYRGHFVRVAGRWNARVEAEARTPQNVRNFFGLGNETENTADEREFYQARYSELGFAGGLEYPLSGRSSVSVIPFVTFTHIRQDEDRFVGQPQAGIDPASFDDQWYGGVSATMRVDLRDRTHFPRVGFLWSAEGSWHQNLAAEGASFTSMQGELSLYFTPGTTGPLTLAGRAGATHRSGDFPFHAAATIGGNSNLRGWRGTRFAGRTAAWQGFEARLRIGRFATLLANGNFGLLGFVDQGRVWTDGEHSDVWHRGFGGGVWAEIFDSMVVSSWVGTSVEQTDFTLRAGFFF